MCETFRFLVVAAVWTLALFGAATLLTGCSVNDAQYLGCLARDNSRNPCN